MAYHFSAEKCGEYDLQNFHDRLTHFELIEFFPVEAKCDSLTLGISIPFKGMDDPRFENELETVMAYLLTEQGFRVTDLYTGNPVSPADILGLAKKIRE